MDKTKVRHKNIFFYKNEKDRDTPVTIRVTSEGRGGDHKQTSPTCDARCARRRWILHVR